MNTRFVVIALLLIVAVVWLFNALVRMRNQVRVAWSDVDVQLARRHDLVPMLVEVVKGYASHESALFERVGAELDRSADPGGLAALLKAVPVRLVRTYPLARAISTAGGIAFGEVDDDFMLRRRPGTFVAGEMLDWEAPTGGYLLQATFSTAVAAAHGALRWLDR